MNTKKPVTRRASLHGVAEAAGVSVMTVSNVLNNRGSFSDKTRKRVLRYVDELGYIPTQAARSLRSSSQFSVGFVVVDPSESYFSDYLTGRISTGLSRYLNDEGYNLIVRACRPEELKDSEILRRLTVDALVLLSVADDTVMKQIMHDLDKLKVPLVVVQNTVPSDATDCASVRQADYDGGRMIADHLLARGARRILAVVKEDRWPAFEARLSGLQDGIAGVTDQTHIDVLRVKREEIIDARKEIKARLDEEPLPDAIFGGNDQLALAAMQDVRARGLNVPEDVIISGFNGIEFVHVVDPTLTTVQSDGYAIGRMAGQRLVERLRNGQFEERDTVLPVYITQGGSTQRTGGRQLNN